MVLSPTKILNSHSANYANYTDHAMDTDAFQRFARMLGDPEVWLTFWAREPIMTARLSGGSSALVIKKGDLIGEFRLQ